jgi:D-alanine-D-alanine ligase
MPPTLLLVRERPETCRDRLIADGMDPDRAAEVASYLDQADDIAGDLAAIEAECDARGLVFRLVELDGFAAALDRHDPHATLVWTLTDGFAYFRGSLAPALAQARGFRLIGSPPDLFYLTQDKMRSTAALAALGLPVPATTLARGARALSAPPPCDRGWFVKPNRLGAKIGVWPDSRAAHLEAALALSMRIREAYGDDAVIQTYAPGRNVRVSLLDVRGRAGPQAAGLYAIDTGSDFLTMRESKALTGAIEAAPASGASPSPSVEDLRQTQPSAARRIESLIARMVEGLGFRDVFSVDLRLEEGRDGAAVILEFEVSPGLTSFDFRTYLARHWGMTLAQAMAETAANRLAAPGNAAA